MSRDRLADAYEEQAAVYGRLAETTAQIAHELRGIEPAAARAAVSDAGHTAPTVAAGVAPSASAAPSFDELPPEDRFDGLDARTLDYGPGVTGGSEIPMKPQVDAGLGKCPVHGTGWTIKAGGMSKANKPYRAFWKCSEKDGDAFCDQKPQPIWAQTHPAEVTA